MSDEENKSVNFFFSHYDESYNLAEYINSINLGLNKEETLNLDLVMVLKKLKELGD